MNNRSFIPLFTTNFFGVLNDNFLKTLAGFVVISWIPDESMKGVYMGLTAGALVLPYILFSPLADRLTAVFPKRVILRLAKWAELPIMAVAIAAFLIKSPALAVAAVTLMGLQSALYSPAKYALVRDIGGEARISTGMGGMDGIAFLAVLAGTALASFAADTWPEWTRYAALVGFALAGVAASHTLRAEERLNRELHSVNPVRYLRRMHRTAAKYPGLNALVLALGAFWCAMALMQMGMLVYGKTGLGLTETQTGFILCAAAVGIALGQMTAGFIDKRRFLLGATALTGFAAATLAAILCFVPLSPVAFAAVVTLLAFDCGLFKLPIDTEIQRVVKGPRLNSVLAYLNLVTFLFMLGASALYAALSRWCGHVSFLAAVAVIMAITTILLIFSYRRLLLFTGKFVFDRRYKVAVSGLENAKPGKTYLVLPNHPAMVDPMLVATRLWRTPLKPLSDEAFFHTGIIAPWLLRTLDAVAVPDLRKRRFDRDGAKIARGLSDIVLGELRKGGSVIFYPAGHIHTAPDREEIGTRQLAYNICRELPENVEVLAVRTIGLWGSIWSRAGRTDSPAFVPTLVKSVLLWFVPFRPRRRVTMTITNLTAEVKVWSALPRIDFNRRLEAWYNGDEK